LQQEPIFAGVVFQISVLDDEEIAGGILKAGTNGSAFSLVMLVVEGLYMALGCFFLQNLAGAVF